jgi:hypothetical protein
MTERDIDNAGIRAEEKNPGHGTQYAGHRQRDKHHRPCPVFSWHVRAFHKPGKNGSKRKANGTDYAGIDQRVDEGGVGLRSEKDRPVVIKRKRAGRDKIALPEA